LLFALLGLLEEVIQSSTSRPVDVLSELDFDILNVLPNEQHIIRVLDVLPLPSVHHRYRSLLLDNFLFFLQFFLLEVILYLLTALHIDKLLVSLGKDFLVFAQDFEDGSLRQLYVTFLIDIRVGVLQH
jgi:hypothetical protein